MISIVSVNWKSYEWGKILIESAQRFSSEKNEIVIVENSPQHRQSLAQQNFPNAKIVYNWGPQLHGDGLNMGVAEASGEHVLILDIDCHFLTSGWEGRFRDVLETSYCISVSGSEAKPLRPACVFMKTEDARQYDWRSTPGYQGHRITPDGFDVGIVAYHQMIAEGRKIHWMDKCEQGLSRYGTLTGEEYGLGLPLIYHHWHGTHLKERNEVDYVEHDLMAEKDKLFARIPWRKRAKMV